MQEEFGPDRVIGWEYHCSSSDPFTTGETTARENWYGITGYPTVFFDGITSVVGASNCGQATTAYRNTINNRLSDTEGLSPVGIVASSFEVVGGNALMSATFELMDPVVLTNLRATLILYEDAVVGPSDPYGNTIYNGVTRKIYDQNVTLANAGDQVTVTTSVPVGGSWNPANLHGCGFLQCTSTKEIIQGQMLGRVPQFDYSHSFGKRVRSVPDGNGMAVFPATVKNISDAPQTITLEPGTTFGDWTVDFLVCGDSTPHSGQWNIVLAPGETCAFDVRVHTNATRAIRTGTFKVTSQATGRLQETALKVFNGSAAIFFVDNDGSNTVQAGLVNGMNANGFLFETWDMYSNGGVAPSYAKMDGYDIVVWHTGGRNAAMILTETDAANLMTFMDRGGNLFVTSNSYLNRLGGGNPPFCHDYLGVASYNIGNQSYFQMNGVAGDVIGNGMVLPLHFQFESFAQGDDAVPGATATASFLAPNGWHPMIRNTMARGAKSVFMAERFDAISETDGDPNNARTLVHRVIDWLWPAGTADTDPIDARLASGIGHAQPNPFRYGTEISFALSAHAAGAPVRLEIFDLGGRMIAKVVDGVLTPGSHVQTWDGRVADGSVARSGVYFARLTTREGIQSTKLILLK